MIKVVFDKNIDNSLDAQAKVTKLKGSISGISVSKESISGIKFYRDSEDHLLVLHQHHLIYKMELL